jgi:hypothetical protein
MFGARRSSALQFFDFGFAGRAERSQKFADLVVSFFGVRNGQRDDAWTFKRTEGAGRAAGLTPAFWLNRRDDQFHERVVVGSFPAARREDEIVHLVNACRSHRFRG